MAYPGLLACSRVKNCNPDRLTVCAKLSIAHTSLNNAPDGMHRRAVVVLTKRTFCVGTVCYSMKSGRCYRLNKPIMPVYQSAATGKGVRLVKNVDFYDLISRVR